MKKRLPASFDDLIKRHYGTSRRPALSNSARAEKLFAGYYGKPLRQAKKRRCAPATVLSLSCDTGEILPQQTDSQQFEEYVVSQSLSEPAFEEYVLGEVAAETSTVLAASLPIPRAAEVNAVEEYQVDILGSLGSGGTSYLPPSRSSREPSYSSGNDGRGRAPAVAQSLSWPADTSRAKATDDDFVKDMQAILSGQMVYDPDTKTTQPKSDSKRSGYDEPGDRPAPNSPNEQAIFDRIAQSMEYANKYDLGTVELENRFMDFDRVSELQEKAAKESKLRREQQVLSGAAPGPTVGSADFIEDLDAIRNQRPASAPAARANLGTQVQGAPATSLQSAAVHEIAVSRPQPAAASFSEPIQQVCGFFGTNSAVLTEQQLRDGLRTIMQEERQDWFDAAGNAKSETDNGQFGQLVFYTAGRHSAIRPTTLTSVQAAAISGGVNYGQLLNAGASDAQVNADVTRVRTTLLTGAPNPGNPPNLNALVDGALRNARSSRMDNFAWSAAFVCTCVRRLAIQLGIEAEVSGNHVGRDELLLAHEAHRVYVVEAHSRRFGPNRKDGTYHAFRIDERSPQVGDIVVQDRQANNIAGVVQFDQIPTALPGGRKLHADVVVEVNATDAVTIGGNLSGGARRRRYPLDANGRLVVAREQLYTQEAANGNLANVPVVNNAAGLNDRSTGRIFTLLSLVQGCAAIPGQPMNGGILV